MLEAEAKVKEMIIEKYGKLNRFCEAIDMPWTTLDSILKRGFAKSNIINVMKIAKALDIDTESLAYGNVVPSRTQEATTLAAHFDGEEYTDEEMEEILQFAEFVKNKRKSD